MKFGRNDTRGDALSERLLVILLNPWFLAATVAILLFAVSLELISPRDEAIWTYSAWLWAEHGDPPYVGSFENKPAAIFLLYRLSYALFGLSLWPMRVLAIAAMVGTMALLYTVGRRYQSRIAGAMAALVFGLAMGNRITDGWMPAVTETFMMFFTALAFYMLSLMYWDQPTRTRWRCMFGVGAALGAAMAFKQIALFDVVGLIPMYCVATRGRASVRIVVSEILLALFACIAVTALSVIPLLASGVTLRDYWYGAWGILFHQNDQLSASHRLRLIASTWTNASAVILYPFILLYLFQQNRLRKAGIPFWSLLFWLALDFAAANASNVYKHQLKPMMVPLSLVAGMGIDGFVQAKQGFASRWLLWIYLSIVMVMFPANSILVVIGGRLFPDEVLRSAAAEERTNHRVAEYIRSHTDVSDPVYLWELNSHPIHLYAQRRSSCRYFNTIFHFAPDFEASIAADLEALPPKLILIGDSVDGRIPSPPSYVMELIARSYTPVCRIDNFQVFQQSSPGKNAAQSR